MRGCLRSARRPKQLVSAAISRRGSPGQYVFGVECDGATYHSARSARDRDRIRQEVLESQGWRLYRIWSTDWFRHTKREAEKLINAIKLAAQVSVGPEVPSDDEFSESTLEEAQTSPELRSDDKDEQTPSDDVVHASVLDPYQECVLSVPFRRGLNELSTGELAKLALMVVEAESPVHTDEIARRIREAFGLQKTGRRILAAVESSLIALHRDGVTDEKNGFWAIRGKVLASARSRRTAALPLRKAAMIAPSEYRAAITRALNDAFSLAREDVHVEVSRLFGFDRTGPDLKREIDRQLELLIKSGGVLESEGKIRSGK